MDNLHPQLRRVVPTIFVTRCADRLCQCARVTIDNPGPPRSITLVARTTRAASETWLADVPSGESTHEVDVDDVTEPADAAFALKLDGAVVDQKTIGWQPAKHWVVHVVQNSHHDLGYTNLASAVLREHAQWLDDAIDTAEATRDFPADAQFRLVVEQAWSLQHFLRTAPAARAAQMIALLRAGQFELTALYGNLTTELCGPETLIRALYESFRLKREHGIPITSAEHNDITGVSWGVCQALADAGVRFFAPGLPLYYNWGDLGLESFWDEPAIFPGGGPGAFWWEAPSGRRLLFWCNNTGCGGDCRPDMPGLAGALERLTVGEEKPASGQPRPYPYNVLRWPVIGGARDNSPYVDGYARTIRAWNEKWAYPRLVCSTNARFYADFVAEIEAQRLELPVFRGELPGQDYPVGATSTAAATAVDRRNHIALLTAEKLATTASLVTGFEYPRAELDEAHEDTLMYDEHAWGHHFPAGPAAKASQAEKAVHACRAAALAHDVITRSLAIIADRIQIGDDRPDGCFHLVVFNATDTARTGVVRAPLREIDNCGSTMVRVQPDDGASYLRGVLLGDRWHVNLPPDMIDGRFDLIDLDGGDRVPFQVCRIDRPDEPMLDAPERVGIGSGSRRYGMFESPDGLRRDLCFVATGVPPLGYKTYRLAPRLAPRRTAPRFKTELRATAGEIENAYYRVTVSRQQGGVASIYDKQAGRELIDPACAHAFGALVARDPYGQAWQAGRIQTRQGHTGPLCASIVITGTAHGHPAITQTVTLYAGIKQIDVATRILKDATPLLDAHLAFPFQAAQPQFRYEGALAAMTPISDTLPGSQSDCIAVQNWVKVADGDFNILWSSLDAPVAGFGGLWPGYVSPAHRCLVLPDRMKAHHRLTLDDLRTGWIYSNIAYNNLGTNFSVSQSGELLFRYAITTRSSSVTDREAASFGWQAVTPFEHILARDSDTGSLPPIQSLVSVDDDRVILLNVKRAEDGRGVILQLWNLSDSRSSPAVRFNAAPVERVFRANAVEEDAEELPCRDGRFQVAVDARSMTTLRIITRTTDRLQSAP